MVSVPIALGALTSLLVLVTTSSGAPVSFPDLEVVFLMGWVVAGVYALYLGLAYLPVLLAWGRWGQRFGPWERRRGRLCVALAGLAVSAAVTAHVISARMELPFGSRGPELARLVGAVFVGTWLGMVLPRLVLPALRPGAFAKDPMTSREDG